MTTVAAVEEPTGSQAPVEEPTQTAQRPEHVPEKFWNSEKGEVNVEALSKSYTELEQKQGDEKPSGEGDDTTPTTEEGEGDETDAISTLLSQHELSYDDFNAEFDEKGTLSDESFAKLEKAGFSKEMVEQYLRGGVEAAQENSAQSQLAKQVLTDLKAAVGGEEKFTSMTEWARDGGMNAEQIAAYNEMVTSTSKAQVQAGIAYLNSMYSEAEGTDSTLVNGDPGGEDFSAYRSTAELSSDMRDPRYAKDPAFRADVAKKLERSKIL